MTKIITVPVEISNEGLIEAKLVPINELIPISTHRYSFLESIPHGIKRAGTEISSYAKQIKLIFSPKTEVYKSLGGVLTLGSVFPTYWSWELFWSITAFFSIVLAIMNILPIPGLDGGHVLFLLVEVITRRKPSDKFLERATTVGFILILALLIYAKRQRYLQIFHQITQTRRITTVRKLSTALTLHCLRDSDAQFRKRQPFGHSSADPRGHHGCKQRP